jgi:hypothetical protein
LRCCEPATTTVRWRWWCRTDAARATKQLAVHLAEQGAEFPVGASFPHLFFATAAGVVVIAVDPGDPDVMHRPPRDPKVPITNRTAVLFWLWYAVVVFVATLAPLVVGPDEPSPDRASAFMTMTFVVIGLGTVFNALAIRRRRAPEPPAIDALRAVAPARAHSSESRP